MKRDGYYIGIDGGGTGSRLRLEFEDGRAPVRLHGGPLNLCSVSEQAVEDTLKGLFCQVADIVGDLRSLRGVGRGVAGFTNPNAVRFFRKQFLHRFPNVPLALGTDAQAALYGAHLEKNGIVLISGTGSVCYGIHHGLHCQVGGGGHLIDDEGSGYAIGRDILRAVLHAQDGRSSHTLLEEALRENYGISNQGDLIAFTYAPNSRKETIAAIAPLLTPACEAGDPAALAIARKAAEQLALLAKVAVTRLQLEKGPIALSGSVLTKEPFVRRFLCEELDKNWENIVYYSAKADACVGATLMARWAAAQQSHALVPDEKGVEA